MKLDKPLAAAAIGILSAILYEVFLRVMLFFGLGKYSLYELDSFIVTIERPSAIIGFVVGSAVACFIAGLLYFATNKIGTDHFVIKTVIVSVMAWVALEAIFTSSIEGRYIPIRPMSDYYTHMLGSVVFGVSLGLLFKRYLFKKSAS